MCQSMVRMDYHNNSTLTGEKNRRRGVGGHGGVTRVEYTGITACSKKQFFCFFVQN